MQGEQFRTALAVYTPEEYTKIRALSEDADSMEETWEEWRQSLNSEKFQAVMRGIHFVEVPIGANGLVKYCLENNAAINGEARAGYAAWLLRAREISTIQLQEESLTLAEKARGETAETDEQAKTELSAYGPPVNRLLKYTSIDDNEPLPRTDYAQHFGLGQQDIPELVRMATDKYLRSEAASGFEYAGWLHALHALGQLRAEEAIEPLLPLFDEIGGDDEEYNEWLGEELPRVLGEIGPAAISKVSTFLLDNTHTTNGQINAGQALVEIARNFPETREECVAMLMRSLEKATGNSPEVNGFLIGDLLDLEAKEAAPVIERVHALKVVDESISGDWLEVQYELGLKERPPQQRRELRDIQDLIKPASVSLPPLSVLQPAKSARKAAPSKKSKTKMAKASKKANRKRK